MDAAGDWNMNNDAIGVFDSGIGGLTAVKALRALMPNENIIYFGDTARIPYGSRSRETVLKYANEDIAFLRKFPIKMIIAACGTVSTILGTKSPVTQRQLRQGHQDHQPPCLCGGQCLPPVCASGGKRLHGSG